MHLFPELAQTSAEVITVPTIRNLVLSRAAQALTTMLAALTLAACGGNLPPERPLELTVTAAGYEPARLEAQAGEMVSIRFQNRDEIAHNLTIELPSGPRAVSAEARVDAVLSFPARDAGSFRFFCAVPGHTEEGLLIVIE